MTQLFKNAARSALQANILSTDTSITIASADADLYPVANTNAGVVGTPGLDWFKATLQDAAGNIEIVYVRTRALGAATFTNCQRGQEGTTARAYLAGSTIVGLRLTALDLQAAIDLAASATTAGKAVLNAADAAAQRTAIAAAASGANSDITSLLGLTTGLSSSRVKGLVGNVNAGTPLTKYDLSADEVVLRNANGGTVTRYNVATITCDLGLAGPARNGRDQAAAFTSGSWVHLYYIWNGTSVATIASPNAPSTGPVLPGGDTHWTYAGAVRWNASSNIIPGRMQGNWFWYDLNDGGVNRVLTAGVQTAMTAVVCSGVIPPNATLGWFDFFMAFSHNTVGAAFRMMVRPTGAASTGIRAVSVVSLVASQTHQTGASMFLPLGTSTQIDYAIDTVPNVSGGAYIDVYGYAMPNGG